MSMLAEKKRREKWSLNPRGKAWSEDQNKFGQRLMEKMGWKTGQGLGANSQGVTDIVKTRVKNDSKGLGFKENGEEWLKTTSDFDNLLDKLGNSHEDNSEGSQSETPTSLEDRSRKSRARVHYHKFTRGKDISRYSEKDLASIIGPDIVKMKNDQESGSDYTQNQVNKGSLEEYFSKKSKFKDGKPVDSTTSDNNNCEQRKLEEDIQNSNLDLESEVTTSSKKKKKRKKHDSDVNEAEVNPSTDNIESRQLESDQHISETEKAGKKKKKSKSSCDFKNDTQKLEENDQDRLNLSSEKVKKKTKNNLDTEENEHIPTESSIICESHDNISKKRKRKYELSPDVTNTVHLENTSQTETNTEDKTQKKKKKRVEKEETIHTDYNNDDCANENTVAMEETAVDEVVSKKKKKKAKDENKDHLEGPLEEHQIKKSKKEKKKKQVNGEITYETEPGCEQVNNDTVSEIVTSSSVKKKKKQKKDKFMSL